MSIKRQNNKTFICEIGMELNRLPRNGYLLMQASNNNEWLQLTSTLRENHKYLGVPLSKEMLNLFEDTRNKDFFMLCIQKNQHHELKLSLVSKLYVNSLSFKKMNYIYKIFDISTFFKKTTTNQFILHDTN
jgi:hypothetical protein